MSKSSSLGIPTPTRIAEARLGALGRSTRAPRPTCRSDWHWCARLARATIPTRAGWGWVFRMPSDQDLRPYCRALTKWPRQAAVPLMQILMGRFWGLKFLATSTVLSVPLRFVARHSGRLPWLDGCLQKRSLPLGLMRRFPLTSTCCVSPGAGCFLTNGSPRLTPEPVGGANMTKPGSS